MVHVKNTDLAERAVMTAEDPDTGMPLSTSMLYRVCKRDPMLFGEATRIMKEMYLAGQRNLCPSHFDHGSWDCDDSPTGKCVYTSDHDDCIFCHGPEERK
jgi:hypothetical protein